MLCVVNTSINEYSDVYLCLFLDLLVSGASVILTVA